MGLFSGEFIFRGAYYWREFCVLKWSGLDKKNNLKHKDNSLKLIKTANLIKQSMGLYLGGLIIGRINYYLHQYNAITLLESSLLGFSDLIYNCQYPQFRFGGFHLGWQRQIKVE